MCSFTSRRYCGSLRLLRPCLPDCRSRAPFCYTRGVRGFAGGTNALFIKTETEAAHATRLWQSLGIAPERIVIEDRSRNSYENAVFTRDLVQPKAGDRWLLVTSAYHMPRSIGLFRKVGFP